MHTEQTMLAPVIFSVKKNVPSLLATQHFVVRQFSCAIFGVWIPQLSRSVRASTRAYVNQWADSDLVDLFHDTPTRGNPSTLVYFVVRVITTEFCALFAVSVLAFRFVFLHWGHTTGWIPIFCPFAIYQSHIFEDLMTKRSFFCRVENTHCFGDVLCHTWKYDILCSICK